MHFTMTCTTTHNGGPPGVLAEGTYLCKVEGHVRNTLALVRSKSFSLALEAEGRRSLTGMPEVSSLRACLNAYKSAIALALPGVPGGKDVRVLSVRFAMPTLRASPTNCLHRFPISGHNHNASQKLVLKLEDYLLHVLHLLIEVSGDNQASSKSPLIPPIHAKP